VQGAAHYIKTAYLNIRVCLSLLFAKPTELDSDSKLVSLYQRTLEKYSNNNCTTE